MTFLDTKDRYTENEDTYVSKTEQLLLTGIVPCVTFPNSQKYETDKIPFKPEEPGSLVLVSLLKMVGPSSFIGVNSPPISRTEEDDDTITPNSKL